MGIDLKINNLFSKRDRAFDQRFGKQEDAETCFRHYVQVLLTNAG